MAGLKAKARSNGIYYATGTLAGERIRKSLRIREKRQAEELCALHEAKLWKRHSYGEKAVRTFEEAAASYMEAGGEARFLQPLLRRFKGRLLGSITPEEVRQVARSIYPTGTGATLNRQGIVPTRAVITHAAGRGWCVPLAIGNFPVKKTLRIAVSREWIDAFVDRADDDQLPHLAAAVLFMWQTGARVSEAARILPEHVNLADRIILLERTKEGEWEECHITRELMIRLANLPQTEGKPLFGYSSRFGITLRMKAVCRRAGIDFVSPHQSGRHSYATNALAMGATVKEVMDGGRWKTARLVLETYAHSERAGRSIADRFDTELVQPKQPTAQPTGKKAK